MERKQYLELCQKNAVWIKSSVVLWNGMRYYPSSYMLAFDGQGKAMHIAVLIDEKTNSVLHCKLEDVDGGENDVSNVDG